MIRVVKKLTNNKMLIILSIVALMFLIMPADAAGIMKWFIILIGLELLIIFNKDEKGQYLHVGYKHIFFIIWLSVWLGLSFYMKWSFSSKIKVLSELFHMGGYLLVITTVILAIMAVPGILAVYNVLMHMCIKRNILRFKRDNVMLKYLIICAVIVMEYAQMFIGSQTSMDNFFSSSLMMFIMNVCVIFIFNDAVLILTRSWKRTLIATSVIITVFSIINSYVVLFHGSPITISDIYNVSTALNVLGGYTIYLTDYLVNEIALMCFEFLLIFLLDEKNDTRISIRQIVVHFGIIIVAILSVVGYVKLKEIRIGWGWRSAIEEYGYSLYAISDVLQEANKYICPDGYDADNITVANVEYKSSMDEYPDIILILNESFCNLEYYTDINADCNYLGDFYSVEGAVYGYAEVPGGGTNNSEFELLTSKSMYLLTSSAPFNYVDFTKAKSSVVQYIGNLGYVTSGMHVSKTNYSRHRAYPALGFDTVLLGEDFFTENKYGNRAWSDASMYEDMINCYNDNLSDNPQFIYLLTYQNHGGYEQNDDDMDTVHTLNDYGGITDDVNEYLSSIAMSATAFKELTNYFSSVERDVIICMVGDHAPAFIDELPYINGDDGDMKIIDEKMVPYVMWSNYGLDFSACTEYVSMVDIVPLIIESAGLPMTSFYQTILNIHEEIPIRCSDGTYVDNDGVVGMYGNDSIYYEMMTQYYYMEYNSLVGGGDYREELFLPTP